MIESEDKKQNETATLPSPGDFPISSPESRVARIRLQGIGGTGRDPRECICFLENENPFFITPEEEEAAARIKWALHGDRFKRCPRLLVPDLGTVEQFPNKCQAMKSCEFLKATINREARAPRTLEELVSHYKQHELPTKTPYTSEVYTGYLKTWILPKWAEHSLSDVKAVAVESWLKTVKLSPGTKAKLRNLMHAIFNHAMRWEFASVNPITLVRQSAKRTRVPDVLTAEEIGKLLFELKDPWRTAVYVAVTTGLRVSELLALKWADADFAAGEIRLSRGIVRQHIGEMKTEASRRPVPLDAGLADVLIQWRGCCPYKQDADYVFGSPDKHGKQPYWPNAAMEDHIRPAAKRAGIQKRLGWHTLRHTFGTLVKSQGADVATTQALLRHANVSITMDRYVQAVTPAKREAQSRIVKMLPFPNVPTRLTGNAANA